MDRQIEITKILLDSKNPLTVNEIGAKLKVSNKTVRNDLEKIKKVVRKEGLSLSKKPGVGISIEGSEDKKLGLLNAMKCSTNYVEPYTSEYRCNYILKRLFMNKASITIKELANELYVSRVTIHKDLEDVERWLERYKLELLKRTNYGLEIIGDEENWRNAIASLIASNREQEELKELLYDDYSGKLDYKTITKLKNLINIDFWQLEKIVESTEQKLKLEFSEEAFISLLIHIAISIKRLKEGKDIKLSRDILDNLRGKDEYMVASEMAIDIEEAFKVKLPESEIGYILLHILGTKMQQNKVGELNLDLEAEMNTELAVIMAKEIIQIAGRALGTDFSYDKELLNGLILHLRPTINRLKYGLTLRNPILDEIKENYPEIYGAAWMTSIVFEKYLGVKIQDEEIAYIALHIGGADERNIRPYKVLVVCPSGIGTSQLLAAKLERCFRQLEIKNVTSYMSIKEKSLKEIDLVISTVPIEVKKPVLVISPLLVQNDIKKIENFLDKMVKQGHRYLEECSIAVEGELKMLLNEDLVLLDVDATSKNEVISMLAAVAEQQGKVSSREEYIKSVLEREKSFPTAVGNGVAIPHGKSSSVNEAMVVFAKLNNGIDWDSYDGEAVDLIFLLGIPETSADDMHLRLLAQLSRKLVNEDFIALLRNAKTSKEVYDALADISIS